MAPRTQQILAHETGVTNTVDPLGGSYFVEALTDRMEQAAYEYFQRIDQLGGMVDAIKQSYPQREIADASFRLQQEMEREQRIAVGARIAIGSPRRPSRRSCASRSSWSESRSAGCKRPARRDGDAVERALADLRETAATEGNLMNLLLDRGARANCSEGEIVESLQRVFGMHTSTPVF